MWGTFFISEKSAIFKRVAFPGNIWPSYVFKSFESGVESIIYCAGLCKAERADCNTVFYDKLKSSCALANLIGNYSTLQKTGAFGYVMQGNKARHVNWVINLVFYYPFEHFTKKSSSNIWKSNKARAVYKLRNTCSGCRIPSQSKLHFISHQVWVIWQLLQSHFTQSLPS